MTSSTLFLHLGQASFLSSHWKIHLPQNLWLQGLTLKLFYNGVRTSLLYRIVKNFQAYSATEKGSVQIERLCLGTEGRSWRFDVIIFRGLRLDDGRGTTRHSASLKEYVHGSKSWELTQVTGLIFVCTRANMVLYQYWKTRMYCRRKKRREGRKQRLKMRFLAIRSPRLAIYTYKRGKQAYLREKKL